MTSSGIRLSCVALLSVLASCGSLRRAGTDAYVVATSPVRVFAEGASDTAESADALELTGFGRAAAAPILFTYHTVEHILFTGLHAGDLLLSPIYGGYDLASDKEILPLEIYTDLDLWEERPGVISEGNRANELRQEYRDSVLKGVRPSRPGQALDGSADPGRPIGR